jgi:hypothetical protein
LLSPLVRSPRSWTSHQPILSFWKANKNRRIPADTVPTADSENNSSSESESDSDTDWEDIARYIFKEGLKMMKTAASYEWFDMDEETRNDYVRLWKKMGRKKASMTKLMEMSG